MANASQTSPIDSAHTSAASQEGTIDYVGMAGIALPISLMDSTLGKTACEATVTSLVDLADKKAKGIHMSRLYLLLQTHQADGKFLLSPHTLQQLLTEQVSSQKGLSTTARLTFSFDLLAERPALRSDNKGWKAYPVTVDAHVNAGTVSIELSLKVPYSSTCPCSAALSRQRLSEAFEQDFALSETISKEQISEWLLSARGSVATPHSQRSWATLKLKLDTHEQEFTEQSTADAFPIIKLIDAIEDVLATPVQTAVKRADEQAFAELNGSNLMFCEDSVRRITATLNPLSFISDFWIKVEHLESLHAHDAIAINTKGITNGYTP